jgi:hypothetical protein
MCIYGQPGIGKTTLAFTADRPLLLDFDRGVHRSANRKDTIVVSEWSDVTEIDASDLEDYGTVIVDTAGRALDVLALDIIKRDPKMGRGGALTLPGYGRLKAEFVGWMRMLNAANKDVVLLAHMTETYKGDEVIERIDASGGSKEEIYKLADAMGRLQVSQAGRVLNFNPTDAAYGKNPGRFDALVVPKLESAEFDTFLASIITRIKERLNEGTKEQQAEMARMKEWRDIFAEYSSLDEFNEAVVARAGEDAKVKGLLLAEAKAKGFAFDKKTKKFTLILEATEA